MEHQNSTKDIECFAKARCHQTFSRVDTIKKMASNFHDTYCHMVDNSMIQTSPKCEKCDQHYKFHKVSAVDPFIYKCPSCPENCPIRERSFTAEFPSLPLTDIAKLAFYYFCRGYGVDDVANAEKRWFGDSGSCRLARAKISGMFKFLREVIGWGINQEVRCARLGGPGVEVYCDTYRLPMKTASNVDEFWIIGFVLEQDEHVRARCYLTGRTKPDDLAIYIAKTVARHSTLMTPWFG